MAGHLGIKLGQLVHDHRGERVLDTSIEYLVSGSNNANLLMAERLQYQNRLSASQLHRLRLDRIHLFFFNDQRNDTGTRQLVTFLHGKIAMAGGDHHLSKGIDPF